MGKDYSRRKFLKTIAASVGGGSLLSNIVSGKPDHVSIPYIFRGGEIVEERSVPGKWYRQFEKTLDVVDRLDDQYGEREGIAGISQIFADTYINGQKASEVLVEVEQGRSSSIPVEKEGDNGFLPSEIDSIQIQTEYAADWEPTACFGDHTFKNTPGGVTIESGGGATTFCGAMKGGTRYMFTAAHLFEACSSNPGNDNAYQNGTKIGEPADWSAQLDWAAVKGELNGFRFYSQIREGPGQRVGIEGVLTKSAMADRAARQGSFSKVGVSTGLTRNQSLRSVYYSGGPGCIDLANKGIQAYNNQAGGDSGGPIYAKLGNGTHLCAIATLGANRIGTACQNPLYEYAGGCQAATIVRAGYDFTY